MKQLYMITLGGKLPKGHSEIHDVQFMIAEDVEETYEALKVNWKGLDLKLHLDSYKALEGADGYAINVVDEPVEGQDDLYFVFVGGYDPKVMLEIHDVGLFVCENANQAKVRAAKELLTGMVQVHADFVLKVTEAELLNQVKPGYLKLTKTDKTYDRQPDWHGYRRIDQ